MRRICFLVLLAVSAMGCGDDAPTDEARDLSVRDGSLSEPLADDEVAWRAVELMWVREASERELEATLAYCGDSYRLDVVETEDAVTVLAETSDPEEPPAPDCATSGTITLERTLGSRTVMDAATGAPVPER